MQQAEKTILAKTDFSAWLFARIQLQQHPRLPHILTLLIFSKNI